jgi:hypothetical protein
MAYPVIVCIPKTLPRRERIRAAKTAYEINPVNHAPLGRLSSVAPGFKPTPAALAIVRTSYWGAAGVTLTVGFLDSPPQDLRTRILSHMNAWAKTANVKFVASNTDPRVRIARGGGRDGGYWSYVGTDILHIARRKPTMNLEDFTMSTPESEFHRVVRHETGHTLGFPHEHMRRQLVNLIDPKKAIAYFRREDGWDQQEVIDQVLTPIEDSQLMETPRADPRSIMCYQIPGSITKNGKPIIGGRDIDRTDYAFAAQVYPKSGKAPPKPRRKGRKL